MARTKKIPKARPSKRAGKTRARFDHWVNQTSGLGLLGKDKRMGSDFYADLIDQTFAEEIWRGDDLAARIVETIPNEMMREGFEILIDPGADDEQPAPKETPEQMGTQGTGPAVQPGAAGGLNGASGLTGSLEQFKDPLSPAPPPAAPGVPSSTLKQPDAQDTSKEDAEAMEAALREMKIEEVIRRALYYSRAYGGSGVILGIDDGTTNLALPLNEKRIRSFTWINALTPRELRPAKWYSDPAEPRYGEVALYYLVPVDVPPGADPADFPLVHESRIIRFGGVQVSRAQMLRNAINPGWDDSVFVRIVQLLSDFQASFQAVGILLQDFAPAVLKMAGLAKLAATGPVGSQAIEARLSAVELGKSTARLVVIDKEEEYARQSTTLTGLPDLLEKLMLRLAAGAGMPVSLLMGQAPAGLNATGDSDIRWFYDQIAAMQERNLKPALRRLVKLLFLSKDGPTGGVEPENWDIQFKPLWQLTEAEEAARRLQIAQAMALYITNRVLVPEEVAKSLFGGDKFSSEVTLDFDARAALLAAQAASAQMQAQALAAKSKAQGTDEPPSKTTPDPNNKDLGAAMGGAPTRGAP